MVNEILGSIPFVGGMNWANIRFYLIWFIMLISIVAASLSIVIIVLWKKLTKKIIEIDGETHKIQICSGRTRKLKGVPLFWVGKFKKFLPRPQQKDLYLNRGRDSAMLYKDNNGLHHTLRLPTYEEIRDFYKLVKGIDITQEYIDSGKKDSLGMSIKEKNPYYDLYQVFFLPNPYEKLGWLATQCTDADKEYKAMHWYQSPIVIYGVAMVAGVIIFISSIVLSR